MNIHIMIPTLQGVSAVQKITKEDSDIPSVICLNSTSQSLPISNAYYDFVKKGQGVIAKDFGHDAWRIDLSEPVEMGNSWQLGIYLAHYFQQKGQLGNGEPKLGDVVIWATGEVKVNHQVDPVEGVERKLFCSSNCIADWQTKGITTIAVMCSANLALVELPSNVLGAKVDNVKELTTLTNLLPTGEGVNENISTPKKLDVNPTKNKHWGFIATTIALLLSVYLIVQYQGDDSSNIDARIAALDDSDKFPPKKIIEKPAQKNAKPTPQIMHDLPLMHVKKAGLHEQCSNGELKAANITINNQGHFKNQPISELCSLSFEFEPNKAKFVVAYAMDTGTLIHLLKTGNVWGLPLPKDQSRSRDIALIVYEHKKPTDEELRKLKRFLDINIDKSWMNAQDIHSKLEREGWSGLQVYSHTLEQF